MDKRSRLLMIMLVASMATLSTLVSPALAGYGKGGGGGGTPSAITVGSCVGATYSTIQAGVNAAPAGGTVNVCPGIYPEQVEIAKNLTLIGITIGNSNLALVVPPTSGLAYNSTSLTSSLQLAAGIWVHDAAKVNIQNLTIDGLNNNLGCLGLLIGVLYQNASGIVNEVATRNQTLTDSSCISGIGIFIQGLKPKYAYVTVENSSIHDYQSTGIAANENGTNATIYNNTIRGQGPTEGPAEKGIQFFRSTGSAYNNSIADHVWLPAIESPTDIGIGILVDASQGVNLGLNVIGTSQIGIVTESDPANGSSDYGCITSNTIFGSILFDGIDVCSNGHAITNNTIAHSAEAAIFLDDQCDPSGNKNSVNSNTIRDACAALLIGPGTSGNSVGSNSLFNSANLSVSGDSATCPTPLAATATAVATADLNSNVRAVVPIQ